VKQVAELLNQGKTAFVLFDELFKGTNVKDAYDATVLIISGLVEWRQSTFILSSHLSEVESQIKHFPEVVFFFFESEMQNGKPLFNYKIKEGVSDTRLGLTIIENEGIMELLKNPNKL
jgi:DNA mismatch repair ATPase MutS